MNALASYKGEEHIDFGSSNPYKVLGIENKANSKGIKKAFAKLALKYHPDIPHTGNKVIFAMLLLAKETLLDPELRALYDDYYIFGKPPSDKKLMDLAIAEIEKGFINTLNRVITENIDMAPALSRMFQQVVNQNHTKVIEVKAVIEKFEGAKTRLDDSKISEVLILSLDANLNKLKADVANIKQTMIINEKAIDMLENFEYDFDAPPPRQASSTSVTFQFSA